MRTLRVEGRAIARPRGGESTFAPLDLSMLLSENLDSVRLHPPIASPGGWVSRLPGNAPGERFACERAEPRTGDRAAGLRPLIPRGGGRQAVQDEGALCGISNCRGSNPPPNGCTKATHYQAYVFVSGQGPGAGLEPR